MWIVRPRQELDSVVNLENGHFLGIRPVADTRGGQSWEIVSTVPNTVTGTQFVMDGYKTYEDAQEAFAALLDHLDIKPFETADPTVVPADDTEAEEK